MSRGLTYLSMLSPTILNVFKCEASGPNTSQELELICDERGEYSGGRRLLVDDSFLESSLPMLHCYIASWSAFSPACSGSWCTSVSSCSELAPARLWLKLLTFPCVLNESAYWQGTKNGTNMDTLTKVAHLVNCGHVHSHVLLHDCFQACQCMWLSSFESNTAAVSEGKCGPKKKTHEVSKPLMIKICNGACTFLDAWLLYSMISIRALYQAHWKISVS